MLELSARPHQTATSKTATSNATWHATWHFGSWMQAGTFSRETSELPTLHDPPTVHTYIHAPRMCLSIPAQLDICSPLLGQINIYKSIPRRIRRDVRGAAVAAARCRSLRRLQLQLACACCSGCSLLAACGGSGNKGKRRGKRRGKKTFWLFYSKTLNSHLELLLLARGLEGDL